MATLRIDSPFPFGKKLRLDNDPVAEIIFNRLTTVIEETAPVFMEKFRKALLVAADSSSDIKLKIAVFNKVVKDSHNKIELDDWRKRKCTAEVAEAIITMVIFAAKPNYALLKKTKRINNKGDDYGEINPKQMSSMIRDLEPGPNDVFGDLGSGIGQFVCFVAAATPVKTSFGIELEPTRAETAKKFLCLFKRYMKFFGKIHGRVILETGSIFDQQFRSLICEEATILFVNNYSFPSEINLQVESDLLKNCRDGLRIVSTTELALGARRNTVNGLQRQNLVAMVQKSRVTSIRDGFSWGPTPVVLTMCTIDRTKLQQFEEEQKKRVEKRKRTVTQDSEDKENLNEPKRGKTQE